MNNLIYAWLLFVLLVCCVALGSSSQQMPDTPTVECLCRGCADTRVMGRAELLSVEEFTQLTKSKLAENRRTFDSIYFSQLGADSLRKLRARRLFVTDSLLNAIDLDYWDSVFLKLDKQKDR